MMEYQGCMGKVEFDDEARLFHGEVLNIRDVITFQGQSVDELEAAFRESIDDYLAFCKARGETPERPFSGQFVTRLPPQLHREVSTAAALAGKSLNAWVVDRLQEGVDKAAGAKQTASTSQKSKAATPSPRAQSKTRKQRA